MTAPELPPRLIAPQAPVPPPTTWVVPWTLKQVSLLQDWQSSPGVHPYTCPTAHEAKQNLVPTRSGWVCGWCDYTQDWAWAVTS